MVMTAGAVNAMAAAQGAVGSPGMTPYQQRMNEADMAFMRSIYGPDWYPAAAENNYQGSHNRRTGLYYRNPDGTMGPNMHPTAAPPMMPAAPPPPGLMGIASPASTKGDIERKSGDYPYVYSGGNPYLSPDWLAYLDRIEQAAPPPPGLMNQVPIFGAEAYGRDAAGNLKNPTARPNAHFDGGGDVPRADFGAFNTMAFNSAFGGSPRRLFLPNTTRLQGADADPYGDLNRAFDTRPDFRGSTENSNSPAPGTPPGDPGDPGGSTGSAYNPRDFNLNDSLHGRGNPLYEGHPGNPGEEEFWRRLGSPEFHPADMNEDRSIDEQERARWFGPSGQTFTDRHGNVMSDIPFWQWWLASQGYYPHVGPGDNGGLVDLTPTSHEPPNPGPPPAASVMASSVGTGATVARLLRQPKKKKSSSTLRALKKLRAPVVRVPS